MSDYCGGMLCADNLCRMDPATAIHDIAPRPVLRPVIWQQIHIGASCSRRLIFVYWWNQRAQALSFLQEKCSTRACVEILESMSANHLNIRTMTRSEEPGWSGRLDPQARWLFAASRDGLWFLARILESNQFYSLWLRMLYDCTLTTILPLARPVLSFAMAAGAFSKSKISSTTVFILPASTQATICSSCCLLF